MFNFTQNWYRLNMNVTDLLNLRFQWFCIWILKLRNIFKIMFGICPRVRKKGKHALSSLLTSLSLFAVFSIELPHLFENFFGVFPFLFYSPALPPVFLQSPLWTIFISMEEARSKFLHSHFCVWLNNDRFHVEDVEAQRSLVISKAHLNWFLTVIVELVRCLEDHFFLKFGELDRGRRKLSKFRSENGWVLCCDFWLASDGCSTIRVLM